MVTKFTNACFILFVWVYSTLSSEVISRHCLHVAVYFDQFAATLECHAADTGHDTPPRHNIQTQGRPVAVLSIELKRHTGIHNYPF